MYYGFLVQLANITKFKEGGGLGISLEGKVDVEDGVERQQHHFIHSILNDGPVGKDGRLKSGDELLQVEHPHFIIFFNHAQIFKVEYQSSVIFFANTSIIGLYINMGQYRTKYRTVRDKKNSLRFNSSYLTLCIN